MKATYITDFLHHSVQRGEHVYVRDSHRAEGTSLEYGPLVDQSCGAGAWVFEAEIQHWTEL